MAAHDTYAIRHRALRRGVGLTSAAASALALVALTVVQGSALAAGAPVDLGTAAQYSVLGGQSVTNTGPSVLGAGVAVSPGTALTGFPPGIVGGATDLGNAVAAGAQEDLVIAYDDAAGRAPDASVDGDLGDRTFTAGTYTSAGPLFLTGNVDLDAQGDEQAVFVFQIASTLITASGSSVSLINGAQACNVFWQVGSSATLGTNSTFVGTVMALASVTVTTGATVAGRALARNGSVTLDSNTFVDPGCVPDDGGETSTVTTTPADSTDVTPTDETGPTPSTTVDPTTTVSTGTGSDSSTGTTASEEVTLPTTPIETTGPDLPTTPVETTGPDLPTTPVETTGPDLPTTPVETTGPDVPTTPVETTEPSLPTVPSAPSTDGSVPQDAGPGTVRPPVTSGSTPGSESWPAISNSEPYPPTTTTTAAPGPPPGGGSPPLAYTGSSSVTVPALVLATLLLAAGAAVLLLGRMRPARRGSHR